MKKQEKGITLTVLVITMLLMGIIVGTTFKLSNDNLKYDIHTRKLHST